MAMLGCVSHPQFRPPGANAQMAEQAPENGIVYLVVVNHEEQYSIWPEGRDLPLGWREEGKTGAKADCLAYIEQIWTDMRPLSVRRRMESQVAEPPGSATNPGNPAPVDPRD